MLRNSRAVVITAAVVMMALVPVTPPIHPQQRLFFTDAWLDK